MTNLNKNALCARSDAEVWQALKKGNKSALECLFFRHQPDLYRYAVKLVANKGMAEDHIQALFLKIWECRESLGDVKGVKTYLWTALRRRLLKAQKKQSRFKQMQTLQSYADSVQFSAEEIHINREDQARVKAQIKKALNKLTPKKKEVLYLKFFQGMSYQEIEQIMSISYQTARNYVHEGLKTLKIVMEADDCKPLAPASIMFFLILCLFNGPF